MELYLYIVTKLPRGYMSSLDRSSKPRGFRTIWLAEKNPEKPAPKLIDACGLGPSSANNKPDTLIISYNVYYTLLAQDTMQLHQVYSQ